jgi:surface protein
MKFINLTILSYISIALLFTSCDKEGELGLIYLDENGVSIKAYEGAKAGDTDILDGVIYTVVDSAMLYMMTDTGMEVTNVVTSLITDMSWLFSSFPDDLKVEEIFGDISSWDVSNVTNMRGMFIGTSFNQDISSWDVGNVINMERMFFWNNSFNQDISGWDVRNVTNMAQMFMLAQSFNQDISEWDVRNVNNMKRLFEAAISFNQDISDWDVGNVSNMGNMFKGATSFNQDISAWDVSKVSNMNNMFEYAILFNQDLSSWDVNGVKYCASFADNATSWTLPKPNFENCDCGCENNNTSLTTN